MGRAGLAVGLGRSYGDSGLASSGVVMQTRGLDSIVGFDAHSGVLRCEAGVTLGEILDLVVPAGWVLPVLPGTRFVTVAGAIANDVHGKNHAVDGTFGRHVRRLLLQRSDGELLDCSRQTNPDWFAATVAGLGLTGVMLEAELQLQPVAGPWLDTQTIRFRGLDEFFERMDGREQEYAASWIDCLSREHRGHLTLASHSQREARQAPPGPLFTVPLSPPVSPVNGLTLRLFNELYYQRQIAHSRCSEQHLYSWFFPLDRIASWNRLYGRDGFRQYQCAVPREAVSNLLERIRRSGQGSFLAVLKLFGDIESPGLLSFPRPGATLALDFPWRGERTLKLFSELDAIVRDADGAIYPAKDACMPGADFRRAYPAWETVERYRDPAFKSLFWDRVSKED
jgi:FAD/FMN-containing dehydrogenase